MNKIPIRDLINALRSSAGKNIIHFPGPPIPSHLGVQSKETKTFINVISVDICLEAADRFEKILAAQEALK